jgi:hypothetical protein
MVPMIYNGAVNVPHIVLRILVEICELSSKSRRKPSWLDLMYHAGIFWRDLGKRRKIKTGCPASEPSRCETGASHLPTVLSMAWSLLHWRGGVNLTLFECIFLSAFGGFVKSVAGVGQFD